MPNASYALQENFFCSCYTPTREICSPRSSRNNLLLKNNDISRASAEELLRVAMALPMKGRRRYCRPSNRRKCVITPGYHKLCAYASNNRGLTSMHKTCDGRLPAAIHASGNGHTKSLWPQLCCTWPHSGCSVARDLTYVWASPA